MPEDTMVRLPMEGTTVRLLGDATRSAACRLVVKAPDQWTVTIEPPRRTMKQSRKFWALCGDLGRQTQWAGEPRSKDDWRTLLISGWHIIEKHPLKLVPGLENEIVALSPHSSRALTEREMSAVLDYSIAWAVMHGVDLREDD